MDRMPVILNKQDFTRWLDPQTGADALKALLKPFDPSKMRAAPASTFVNSAKKPKCLEPATLERTLFYF